LFSEFRVIRDQILRFVSDDQSAPGNGRLDPGGPIRIMGLIFAVSGWCYGRCSIKPFDFIKQVCYS